MKLFKILVINYPNNLKPKDYHLKFGHFNDIGSFMSQLKNILSLLSQSTRSNLTKFIRANCIKNGIHGFNIILISFIFTSILF